MNRQGPPLVDWTQILTEKKAPSPDLTVTDKSYVVDIRDTQAFAAGHISNSVNIGLRGRFETWTGIMVPWGSNIVLCGSEKDVKEGLHRLHRVGYTANFTLFEEWQKANLPLNKNELVSPQALYATQQSGDWPLVVDVRLPLLRPMQPLHAERKSRLRKLSEQGSKRSLLHHRKTFQGSAQCCLLSRAQ
jgi:rhodanese-related sulfurtransferase